MFYSSSRTFQIKTGEESLRGRKEISELFCINHKTGYMFLEVMDKALAALRFAGTKKSEQAAFSEINRLEK